jgi:hypothetical protein
VSSPWLGSIKLGPSATHLLKDLFMDTKLYSEKKKKKKKRRRKEIKIFKWVGEV